MIDAGTAAIAAALITQAGTVAGFFLLRRRVARVNNDLAYDDDKSTGDILREIADDAVATRRDVAAIGIAFGQHLFNHPAPTKDNTTRRTS